MKNGRDRPVGTTLFETIEEHKRYTLNRISCHQPECRYNALLTLVHFSIEHRKFPVYKWCQFSNLMANSRSHIEHLLGFD